MSLMDTPVRLAEFADGLVTMIVRVLAPPTTIVNGENDLVTVGALKKLST